jgi:U3 small nucleolar RNA-associated protein 14
VAARRAELRRSRDLLFRAESKAKRVAKIKSKTYRRLRKKERAKLAEKLGDAAGADPDDAAAQMQREVARARERATLRHKSTGKWAQAMRRRGELDDEQQDGVAEMLDRSERLRRRIAGVASGDEDASDDDDDDASDADEGTIRAAAFDELAALRAQQPGDDDPAEGLGPKSVFQMKFMQDAMARGMRRADEDAEDLVRELGGRVAAGSDEDEGAPSAQIADGGPSVQRTGGRLMFQPAQSVSDLTDKSFLALTVILRPMVWSFGRETPLRMPQARRSSLRRTHKRPRPQHCRPSPSSRG